MQSSLDEQILLLVDVLVAFYFIIPLLSSYAAREKESYFSRRVSIVTIEIAG